MALVYLDTNVWIRAFEGTPEAALPLFALFEALALNRGAAVTSELTIAELLAPVKAPGSRSMSDRMELYGVVLDIGFCDLLPVSRSVLQDTAMLRQTVAQKLPDAIHVVTALRAGCRFLMSSDNDTKRLPSAITRVLPDAQGVASIVGALSV